ncbi:MAG: DNA polymerase/3'-5' exonuclease PolX [Thermodesulfovibrio sp.]|nr:DNA polymerase/3'-5' exonuclease PolX [Thermodesulfovibrio sp.]
MKNVEIARIFNEIAEFLEILNENPFRIRAYKKAAKSIESLSSSVDELSEEDIIKIPGIGKDLLGKIKEYLSTGKVALHEELKEKIPYGVITLMDIPGIGPKTAKFLYETLNIKSIQDLEKALDEGKLKGLPGFGAKTEENIRKGIASFKRGIERKPLFKVLPIANEILSLMKQNKYILKIEIAGSLRRWKDTVKDIDIICAASENEKVIEYFIKLPHIKEVVAKGETKVSAILKESIQIDLRVVEEKSFGAALAYFTGSKEHNIRVRELAKQRGLKINEYGVFRESDEKFIGGSSEEEVYQVVGLPWIPPELREDRGEIEAALKNALPKIISLEDIKGDLHIHSNYSDGFNSIEEIVAAALKRNYKYIAITEHSKGLGVAKGLTEDRIFEQKKEIERLRKRYPQIVILQGIEVNILQDGSLDLKDDTLKELDLVIASVHSAFKQEEKEMTKRVIKAIMNPYVHIIGHPTGRLIGEREPYKIDIDEVIKAASDYGKFLEINSYPLRMDLNDINAKKAKEKGVKLVVNTDAHSITQLDYIVYGVSVAKRAWLETHNILNTFEVEELMKLIRKI